MTGLNGIQKIVLAVPLLLACAAPAWAINKCTGPDGKVVFQDALCGGRSEVLNVRPGSGHAPVAAAPASGAPGEQAVAVPTPPTKPQTEAERLEAQLAKIHKDRRKREVELAIPNTQAALNRHTQACSDQQAQLKAKKWTANNNLPGAVWEQSISQEMTAAAQQCATRSQVLLSELETFRKECSTIGCTPDGQ